jgi:hypothetical protein
MLPNDWEPVETTSELLQGVAVFLLAIAELWLLAVVLS